MFYYTLNFRIVKKVHREEMYGNIVKETSRRFLNMRHFDVQLIGETSRHKDQHLQLRNIYIYKLCVSEITGVSYNIFSVIFFVMIY